MRRAARVDGSYLGALCRREHRHDGQDASLRHKSGHCSACVSEAVKARMQDPEKWAHAEAMRKAREAKRRPPKGRPVRCQMLTNKIRAEEKRLKRKANPEEARAYARDFYARNSIAIRLRNRVAKAIWSQGAKKPAIVGGHYIDIPAIAAHLGPPPGPGSEWHIDHVRPLVSFDLSDPAQVALAVSPENHQWLRAEENLRKWAKYA